jgi:menaquinone-specific isochorismate synthase
MRFVRQVVSEGDISALRLEAARSGWLIEDPESFRAGFGKSVVTIETSIAQNSEITDQLRSIELIGNGPRGTGIVAFASLPFDRSEVGRLEVPEVILTRLPNGQWWLSKLEGSTFDVKTIVSNERNYQDLLNVRHISYAPTADEYSHNVARAVQLLKDKEIEKVVLARSIRGTVTADIDAGALAQRLHQRESLCTLYSLPLSSGRRFVGVTPELLVRREGRRAKSHPLAGTIGLPHNEPREDYENWLLNSEKNLHEHSVLGAEVTNLFSKFYETIETEPHPSIVSLRSVAHLGTWIYAESQYEVDTPDAIELVRELHPTAAVGGLPRDEAYELIRSLEVIDRGHYAGPVGWIDSSGDGDWWVGIRGVIIEGPHFEAWAGAGIVSESDPVAEREETKLKLDSVLTSLLVDRL